MSRGAVFPLILLSTLTVSFTGCTRFDHSVDRSGGVPAPATGSTRGEVFHQAVSSGDLQTVERLLREQPELAATADELGDLPIRAAIFNGHTEVAKRLLECMDPVDAASPRGTTPLFYAAYVGNVELTELLVQIGADVDHLNDDGRSALYYAARQGNTDAATALIDHGASIDIEDRHGDTPLRTAIENHHRSMIDLLVARNARLVPADRDDGIHLLHRLAAMGRSTLVSDLLTQGVSTETRDGMGRTLLHNAAAGGLNELISQLVGQGMTVHGTDIYGSTPLHEAALFGHLETVDLLLRHNADIEQVRPDGSTALHLARKGDHQELAALLVARGAPDTAVKFPVLEGDYLGQGQPGAEGALFAPGIVSKAESEDSIRGFYEGNTLCIFSHWQRDLSINWTQWPPFLAKRRDGCWEAPVQSSEVGKPWFFNLESVATGQRMIFAWRKHLDGSGSPQELYLWSAVKSEDGWVEPERLSPPINQGFDTWPSVSRDGTIYFHSWRAGSFGRDDLYLSELEDGEYRTVENLGEAINTEHTEHDACVAPDESFLLFSSFKPGGFGEDDIYVSFLTDEGTWGQPVNLGELINSQASDNRARLSADGRVIFYTSTRTGNLDVYWVDAAVVEELRVRGSTGLH